MTVAKPPVVEERLVELLHSYTSGKINRRDFMRGATAMGAAALGASMIGALAPETAEAAAAKSKRGTPGDMPLDLAEWSYFWTGIQHVEVASGVYVGGKQMYIESFVPAQVKHPYPIVLVHGGGGQGVDWMLTPDGRRGWTQILLEQGYRVYVVDRPGHGRPAIHPNVHRNFPLQHVTLENISGRFTPPNPSSTAKPGPYQNMHNQWPGDPAVGSKELDQLMGAFGGSYVFVPGPAAPGTPPAPAAQAEATQIAHTAWREGGAEMLDKIGPAIIMTHSAGGPFGWLVAELRPNLVKGIVCIEGGGQPFGGANVWGMSTIPVAYDPPVNSPSEIKTRTVPSPEANVQPYKLQEEPARKLKNLQNIPIVFVTAAASFASPGNPGGVAFLRQAGVDAEELRLLDKNVLGNGHFMMAEKNNREVLKPIVEWIAAKVEKGVAVQPVPRGETAVALADIKPWWVGLEHKKVQYGTLLTGQMYIQEMIPAQLRHSTPIVLVHGGWTQMTQYMGTGFGQAGWAHYYLQAGYKVYLVDRPACGRSPFHPDAMGPVGNYVPYEVAVDEFSRSASGPNRQWSGTGDVGDPLIDQFMASQNPPIQDRLLTQQLWASRGAELLDRIGPAVLQVHSQAGPFAFLAANERPGKVKAIVNVEGVGVPFAGNTPWGITLTPLAFDPPVTDPKELTLRDVTPAPGQGQPYKLQAEGSVRKLKNLQGVPIVYITAENSGRTLGDAQVAFLKQAGCTAEHLQLKDLGILGNGNHMMLENNRKQIFDVIHGWVEKTVPDKLKA